MLELFKLVIGEGARGAALRRIMPGFVAETAAIPARLGRARVVGSDKTSMRIDGRTCRDWVFQNSKMVIHVIRRSRDAGIVRAVVEGHR